jgi:NTE family protein
VTWLRPVVIDTAGSSAYRRSMDTVSRLEALPRPLALVLSGGGPRGSAQAGAVAELIEAGMRPDLIIGTSIGALNGSRVASWPEDAGGLIETWLDPGVRAVFRGLLVASLGLALVERGAPARFRRRAALSGEPLRRIVEAEIGDVTFEEVAAAGIPLAVGCVDLLSGDLVYIDSGPVADAILGSAALPGILPPVERDGLLLSDGGSIDNFGVDEAVRRLGGRGSVLLVDASVGVIAGRPVGIGATVDRARDAGRRHQRDLALARARAAGIPCELIAVGGGDASLTAPSIRRGLAAGRSAARRWLGLPTLEVVESADAEASRLRRQAQRVGVAVDGAARRLRSLRSSESAEA